MFYDCELTFWLAWRGLPRRPKSLNISNLKEYKIYVILYWAYFKYHSQKLLGSSCQPFTAQPRRWERIFISPFLDSFSRDSHSLRNWFVVFIFMIPWISSCKSNGYHSPGSPSSSAGSHWSFSIRWSIMRIVMSRVSSFVSDILVCMFVFIFKFKTQEAACAAPC